MEGKRVTWLLPESDKYTEMFLFDEWKLGSYSTYTSQEKERERDETTEKQVAKPGISILEESAWFIRMLFVPLQCSFSLPAACLTRSCKVTWTSHGKLALEFAESKAEIICRAALVQP